MPRGLAPVLAQLVVHVRGGTHAHARRHGVLQRPGVRAVLVHAHREVVHHADVHPRAVRRALRRLELLVQQPLQPHVEVDPVGQPGAGLLRVRGLGRARLVPPQRGVLPQLLAQRAPQCEVLQRLARLRHERLQLLLAVGRAAHGVEQLQGLELGGVGRVPVDRGGVQHGLALHRGQAVHHLTVRGAQVGELRDVRHAQVQGVEEPAARGQVRGGLHGRLGLGRVQGVDEHVVRALHTAQRRERGEIREVPHPPRARGHHRVELRHVPPAPTPPQPVGGAQPPRRHGHVDPRALTRSRDRLEPVPAQAQLRGQRVGHTTPLLTVHLARLGLLVRGGLQGTLRVLVPLRPQPHAHRVPRGGGHGHGGRPADLRDHHGRQQPPPRRGLALAQGAGHGVVVGHVRPQRGENAAQRGVRNALVLAVEALVPGGHTVLGGQAPHRGVP